ncbi:L,D-transpeptidase [Halovulum sp. GXIMD14794]
MTDSTRRMSRRQAVRLLGGASLGLATGACGKRAEDLMDDYATVSQSAGRPLTGLSLDNSQLLDLRQAGLDRRVSGFQARNWQDHFPTLNRGAILIDTNARVLHFWADEYGFYKIYPTSVPTSEDLTRRGRTSVVLKREGPDWRPTPNMRRRNPALPAYVAPGPDNPLGTHALNLGWTYYRIHGTNDVLKVGRRASSGCFGLYNVDIAEVFSYTKIGTQVLVV